MASFSNNLLQSSVQIHLLHSLLKIRITVMYPFQNILVKEQIRPVLPECPNMRIQVGKEVVGHIESCVLFVLVNRVRKQFGKWDELPVYQRVGIRLGCLVRIIRHHIGHL